MIVRADKAWSFRDTRALEGFGGEVLSYMPPDSAIVRLPYGGKARIESRFQSLEPYVSSMKYADSVEEATKSVVSGQAIP